MQLTLVVWVVLIASPSPAPPTGPGLVLDSIVRDSQGHKVALMIQLVDDASKGATVRITQADGRQQQHRFPAAFFKPSPYPGAPAIALAYVLERGGWRLVESKPTTAEACGALWIRALKPR